MHVQKGERKRKREGKEEREGGRRGKEKEREHGVGWGGASGLESSGLGMAGRD